MRLLLLLLPLLAGCAASGAAPALTSKPLSVAADAPTGTLRFLGGLSLSHGDPAFGGLSALRWDDGALVAITDSAAYARIVPQEAEGRLVGARLEALVPLKGSDGKPFAAPFDDAESLTRDGRGGWLIGFERAHRILRYPRLDGAPEPTDLDPVALLGALEVNNGVEAMAGSPGRLFLCAERVATAERANCLFLTGDTRRPVAVQAPAKIAALGGVPVDADRGADGTVYVLFRSFSPVAGVGIGVVALAPDGSQRPLAALRPPFPLDNLEGLAVREEAGRTFLYLISDDNFSPLQRTLLMKFEIVG